MNKKGFSLVQVIIAAGLLIIVSGGIYFYTNRDDKSPVNINTTNTENNTNDSKTSIVKVALISIGDKGNLGKEIGCSDSVVFINREVPTTSQPLNSSLRELFSLGTIDYEGLYNSIYKLQSKDAVYGNELKFVNATIVEGVAKVYLTGDFGGLGGTCDDPRAQAQLEETTKQFPTVKSVEIYLNGSGPVDFSALFDQRG